ncbi:MAG: LCP family protein [Anaerolineae bacterium]
MSYHSTGGSSSPLWHRAFFSLLFLAYIAGGLYFGYLFVGTMRALFADPSVPAVQTVAKVLPRQKPRNSNPPQDTSLTPDKAPTPTWDQGRVNILLLGVDQRSCEETGGAWRTDTMILVSLDPETKTASMLSLPRDLWVEVPTVGPNRLNAAHFFGEAFDYPGGGPALAKRTIQENLAVPVHYYIRINFDGFRKVIDALGGVELDVQEPIWDDRYPTDDCQYQIVQFDAGQYHMDGDQALKYARSRHYSSDFDRARRQQQVLFAIYDKATSIRVIPRLPELWATKGKAVQTDLSLIEVIKLAHLGMQIDRDQIHRGVIDESMTYNMTTDQGWQVLDWDRQKVGALVEELFGISDSLSERQISN